MNLKYQNKILFEVYFSRFNLTGNYFNANFSNANFTDAVVTDCNFDLAKITVEQIQSTWNYKTKNMEGIVLPKEIQETLDKEKQNEKLKNNKQ